MTDFTDFTTYQPPGVYINESATPLVSPSTSAPAVLALVGPSVGYQNGLQTITLSGTTAVALDQAGITSASVVVLKADGTLAESNDFAVTQTGSGAAAITSVARTSDSDIPTGSQVTVSFKFADATYGAAKRFRDFDDVKQVYGEPMDAAGAIVSPLSLAAQLAFGNGASEIICVASAGSASSVTKAQLNTAYAQLNNVYAASVVVPLPVGITGTDLSAGDTINVGTDLNAFLDTSSNDRQRRTGLIGYEKSVTKNPTAIAAGIASKRVGVVWPNRYNVVNSLSGQTVEVGGLYAAAAIGGRQVALAAQESLTRKLVSGFSGFPGDLRSSMTKAARDTWSAGGLMVVETNRAGALMIRHGLSSDMTSLYTRELSLTRAKDRMLQIIEDTLDASGLVGSPIDIDMPVRLKGVVAGCLETAVNAGLIVSYQNLKVRQSSVDPTVMEVKFEYLPSYPVNYIVVSFSVNVENAALTELAA